MFRIYLSFIGSLGQFHGNANRKQEETLLFGSDRSSSCHNLLLSVCIKLPSRSNNRHLSLSGISQDLSQVCLRYLKALSLNSLKLNSQNRQRLKYSPLILKFWWLGEDDEDDTDPGLLWSVQRAVTAPPPHIILHKLRGRNGPPNDNQKWPNSFQRQSLPPSFLQPNSRFLPMPIDSCYSDAMVCYLQSCECKEFLLFVLFVLWIAVGILKNIRTIKLEQLFWKYLILWTLHCGNSGALAVSERALNGTYLMSRICIKHSSILLSWLHPWSIRILG